MHGAASQTPLRMHFLIERHAAPLDHHARAQPLPLLIARYIRPVHDQEYLRQSGQPALRNTAVELGARSLQTRIAEQPIHALYPMAQRGRCSHRQRQRR